MSSQTFRYQDSENKHKKTQNWRSHKKYKHKIHNLLKLSLNVGNFQNPNTRKPTTTKKSSQPNDNI